MSNLSGVWWNVQAGGQAGAIAVNRRGKRFVNECLNYNDCGKVIAQFDPVAYEFSNYPCWIVTDRPLASGGDAGDIVALRQLLAGQDPNLLGTQAANADIVEGQTLLELAAMTGIDPEGLVEEVREFNRHAERGVDPVFHRGEAAWDQWRKPDNGLPNRALAPLGGGPYRAQRVRLRCFGTKGGPVINQDAQIVDRQNHAIPGLFGAGNVVASPFGPAYPGGGGTLGPGTTFGYLAGCALTSGIGS